MLLVLTAATGARPGGHDGLRWTQAHVGASPAAPMKANREHWGAGVPWSFLDAARACAAWFVVADDGVPSR